MKTSQQWWDEVKNNDALFNDWLVKQFRGEVTAAERIVEFGEQYADATNKTILNAIATQEMQHAQWVLSLLEARSIDPSVEGAEKRYWKETLPAIEDFETGCAVGAHAEKMRLERIQVIVDDFDTPADVREVFTKILKDELWHEQAFREMSTPEAMEATAGNHQRGLEVLGLEA